MAVVLTPRRASFFERRSAPRLVRDQERTLFPAQHPLQKTQFSILLQVVQMQCDLLDGPSRGCDFDTHRVAHTCLHQVFDGSPMVAEKNNVYRSGGMAAMIFLIVGRKPMSSMRSASSRTS